MRSPSRAIRRALRLLTKPVRLDSERRGVVIHAYRGYGSPDDVFLIGRLLRQSQAGASHKPGLLGDLIDFARWASRWGIADAPVVARLGGAESRVLTDKDGYFRIELRPRHLPLDKGPWHTMELEAAGVSAVGRVFVPPPASRVVVVSDIDDTLVYTGVANRLKMFWNLFFQSAESRVAFPGAAALYRALHHGATGDQCNPMLYVSRGPWSIYGVLDAFFALHRIPVGPILSMKEVAEEQSLRDTGTVVEVDHPTRGKYFSVGNPVKLSDSPSEVLRSPLLGAAARGGSDAAGEADRLMGLFPVLRERAAVQQN